MMAAIQHQANKPGPKKTKSARRQDIPPHPLVDPANPPHSPTSRAKTHSTRRHHRMVALAAGSSSRSTEISYQTKITTVMLGRVDKLDLDLDAGKQHEGGEALDQLVVAGGDTA